MLKGLSLGRERALEVNPPNKGIQGGEKKPPGDAGETNLGSRMEKGFCGRSFQRNS